MKRRKNTARHRLHLHNSADPLLRPHPRAFWDPKTHLRASRRLDGHRCLPEPQEPLPQLVRTEMLLDRDCRSVDPESFGALARLVAPVTCLASQHRAVHSLVRLPREVHADVLLDDDSSFEGAQLLGKSPGEPAAGVGLRNTGGVSAWEKRRCR